MTTNSQPHNGSAVNTDNSEVRAAIGVSTLDAAAAEGHSPPSSEGAAIGAAAPSPSDATVCQPAGSARAVEGEREPFPPLTGSGLEAADRALLRAENDRLRRLAEAYCREVGRSRWHVAAMNYPWVRGLLFGCGFPFSAEEDMKVYWQVEDEFAELKRKELERKQGQDKEG
jgi:hypothetical protein